MRGSGNFIIKPFIHNWQCIGEAANLNPQRESGGGERDTGQEFNPIDPASGGAPNCCLIGVNLYLSGAKLWNFFINCNLTGH